MIALSRTVRNSFYVVLHDATPFYRDEIREMVAALRPLLGQQMAAAVVPDWYSQHPLDPDFAAEIDEQFGEVLLHGYTHRRSTGRGLVTWWTQSRDEFNGYSEEEAHRRLSAGQAALQRVFERGANGFIAPTFQTGKLQLGRFPEHGLDYLVGFYELAFVDGGSVPLATWCWDMGRLRLLGVLGDWYGTARFRRLNQQVLPCLALHPVDVTRRFLPRIVELVESLLDAGRAPILMQEHGPQLRTNTRTTTSLVEV